VTSDNGALVRRIIAFAVPAAVALLPPVVMLPVLARQSTTAEWAAVAIGQSVGAVAALLVNLGWSLDGPSEAARFDPGRAARAYLDSLAMRAKAAALVVGPTILVAVAIAPPGSRLIAASVAMAWLLAGLSSAWYCIGRGRAGWLIRYEVIPAAIATIVAAAGLYAGLSILIYPLLVGAAWAWGVAQSSRAIVGASPSSGGGTPSSRSWRTRLVPTLTELAGGSYSSGTVALVATAGSVGAVSHYSSGSRLYQMGLVAVIVLSQALQGWVAEVTGTDRRRVRAALTLHLAVGIAGATTLVALGPLVTRVAFSQELAIDRELACAFAAAFFFVALNTCLGRHVLVPEGRVRIVMTSTVVGAVIGVPLTLVLVASLGAVGGGIALAVSEAVVLGVQVPASLAYLRGARPA
jgi:O-antigen/teichoic acid export membrane protein